MNKIVYRVYYEADEAAQSMPPRAALTVPEIAQALQKFPLELETMLDGFDPSVTCESPVKDPSSIVAVIASSATEEQVHAAVDKCLADLDLLGAKLQRV